MVSLCQSVRKYSYANNCAQKIENFVVKRILWPTAENWINFPLSPIPYIAVTILPWHSSTNSDITKNTSTRMRQPISSRLCLLAQQQQSIALKFCKSWSDERWTLVGHTLMKIKLINQFQAYTIINMPALSTIIFLFYQNVSKIYEYAGCLKAFRLDNLKIDVGGKIYFCVMSSSVTIFPHLFSCIIL